MQCKFFPPSSLLILKLCFSTIPGKIIPHRTLPRMNRTHPLLRKHLFICHMASSHYVIDTTPVGYTLHMGLFLNKFFNTKSLIKRNCCLWRKFDNGDHYMHCVKVMASPAHCCEMNEGFSAWSQRNISIFISKTPQSVSFMENYL